MRRLLRRGADGAAQRVRLGGGVKAELWLTGDERDAANPPEIDHDASGKVGLAIH